MPTSNKKAAVTAENPAEQAPVAPEQTDSLLNPAAQKALLACVLQRPEEFAPYAGEFPMLFTINLCWDVADAHQRNLASPDAATMAAAFQEAFAKACKAGDDQARKTQNALNRLQEEVGQIDVDAELPFLLRHIEKWHARRRREQAMEGYLEALEKDKKKPSVTTQREVEAATGELITVLLTGPGGIRVEDAASLLKAELPEPVQVIEGVLDLGDLVIYGGASKSRKTWGSLFAAVCVATGCRLWKFNTVKGRVLYLNFELSRKRFQMRLKAICEAHGCTLEAGMLDVIHLKGAGTKPESLIRSLILQGKLKKYSLVIIDPLYSLLAGKVENSSEEMVELMSMLGVLALKAGCAVWITHHFSKGNQAAKSAIDRVSGSGVFGRFPDSLITMTTHREEDSYSVEFELRNHEEVEPFVVSWAYPLLSVNEDLDATDLKQPKRGGGQKVTDRELAECLGSEWKSISEWLAALNEEGHEISKRTLERRSKDLLRRKYIESKKVGQKTLWRNPRDANEP